MALDKAIKIGLLLRNPVKLTDAPKLKKIREIRPLTEEQANILLQVAKDRAAELQKNRTILTTAANYDVYVAIAIALSTGMRLGEVLGIKWGDIYSNEKVITVRRSRVNTVHGMKIEAPKTGKGRKILIDDELVKMLLLHQTRQNWDKEIMGDVYEDNDWVIEGEFGKGYGSNYFSSGKYKPLLKRAGIDRTFTFHDLRHTHATILLIRGVNPKIVQERLGHATVSMTLDTYSHLMPDNQNSAVNAIKSCIFL